MIWQRLNRAVEGLSPRLKSTVISIKILLYTAVAFLCEINMHILQMHRRERIQIVLTVWFRHGYVMKMVRKKIQLYVLYIEILYLR